MVQSPRIVNYWFYDDNSSQDFGYLILDLHERNLEEYVKEEGDKISESDARRMICQVLKGLRALHTREPRILHRDLKPTNILVDVNCDLVLSDFGIGRFFHEQGKKIIIEVLQLLIYGDLHSRMEISLTPPSLNYIILQGKFRNNRCI